MKLTAQHTHRVINRFTGEVIANCRSYETAKQKVQHRLRRNPQGELTYALNPCQIQEAYTLTYTDGSTATEWREVLA